MSSCKLPPRSSSYWQSVDFSYDDALKAYQNDGHFLSLNKGTKPEFLGQNIAKPAGNSGLWQGDTYKLETCPLEPEPLVEETREPTEPVTVHIVPVRYAFDDASKLLSKQEGYGLPEGMHAQSYLSGGANPVPMTLRQARDGWLYIFDVTLQQWDEYKVEGTSFTKYQNRAITDPSAERGGSPVSSHTYISYPENTSLSLVFSKHRWSGYFFTKVSLKPSQIRQQFCCTEVRLPSGEETPSGYRQLIETLEQVADIDESPAQDDRFALSVVKTQAFIDEDDELSAEEKQLPQHQYEVKPVAGVSDYTASIPTGANDRAYMVAFYDQVADGNDIGLAHTLNCGDYLENEEIHVSRWGLMQAAVQLTMFGSSDDFDYPSSIRNTPKETQFFKDLVHYFEANDVYDRIQNNAQAKSRSRGMQSEELLIQQSELNKAFKAKYGLSDNTNINEVYSQQHKTWLSTGRWRESLHWQDMLEEMQTMSEYREQLVHDLEYSKHWLYRYLNRFGASTIDIAVDKYSKETHLDLWTLHKRLTESIVAHVSEADQQWAEKEFSQPRSLIPLYTSAFSIDVYGEMTKVVKSDPAQSHQDLTTTKSQDITIEEGSNVFTNWMNEAGGYTRFQDMVTSVEGFDAQITKNLFDNVDGIKVMFAANIEAAKSFMQNQAISASGKTSATISSWVSSLILSTFSPSHTQSLPWLKRIFLTEARLLSFDLSADRHSQEKSAHAIDEAMENYQNKKATYLEKKAQVKVLESDRLENVHRESRQAYRAKVKEVNLPKARKAYTQAGNSLKQSTLEYTNGLVIRNQGYAEKVTASRINAGKSAINNANHAHVKPAIQAYDDLGGMAFMVFVMNAMALSEAMMVLSKKKDIMGDDWADLGQKAAYALSAGFGIPLGAPYAALAKDTNWQGRVTLKEITEKIGRTSGEQRASLVTTKQTINIFRSRLFVVAGAGMVATGIETYRAVGALGSLYGSEKAWQWVNFLSLLSLTTLQGTQFALMAGGYAWAIHPALIIALGVSTVIYAIAQIALAYLKKDDYQDWLSQLPWGKNDTHWQWSQSNDPDIRAQEDAKNIEQALISLEKVIKKPIISISQQYKGIQEGSSIKAGQRYGGPVLDALEVSVYLPKDTDLTRTRLIMDIEDVELRQHVAGTTSETGFTRQQARRKITIPTERKVAILLFDAPESFQSLALKLEYQASDSEKVQHQYSFQYKKRLATYMHELEAPPVFLTESDIDDMKAQTTLLLEP
ncbi:hypothetical protein N9R79_05110 [Vibrio sp.]|nr:hypothetical protein [Vibrio sp.]